MQENEDRQVDLFPEEYDKLRVFRCIGGAYIGRFNRGAVDDDCPIVRLSTFMPSVAAAERALAAGTWEPPAPEDSWSANVATGDRATFRAR